jgi:hypothetical protein
MTEMTWSHDDDAWIGQVTGEKLGDIEIRVITDGESIPPTDVQMRSLAVVEQLAQTGLPRLKKLARKYAIEYLGPDEVADMDDEELEIEIHAATIPKLRNAVDTYIIFVGESDIDIEHGVAVVCKNGSQLAVTHSDIAYENYDWDDTAELDQRVGG